MEKITIGDYTIKKINDENFRITLYTGYGIHETILKSGDFQSILRIVFLDLPESKYTALNKGAVK